MPLEALAELIAEKRTTRKRRPSQAPATIQQTTGDLFDQAWPVIDMENIMYSDFVKGKLGITHSEGISAPLGDYGLFPHQSDLVKWALRRGRAAIFADTGLGKSRMQVAWADMVNRHTGSRVIILAPLAVAEQTVEEAASIGVTIRHAREPEDIGDSPIIITNYDRIHKFDCSQFVGVVLDECFAAGTMIDCDHGRKRIQDIRKGDKIVNASGIDVVADTHRREVPYGVKIKSKGQHFIASPNHPIFTQRGWVGAQDLRPGDYALETGASMHLVRGDLFAEGSSTERAAVLRDILLSEMADEHAGAQGESPQTGDIRQDSRGACGMEGIGQPDSGEGVGAHSRTESNIETGSAGEDFSHIEIHEARTFRAWGEWGWANGAAGVYGGCAWRRMDSGICFVFGPTDSGLSNELQARLGESRAACGNRTGWELPPRTQGERRKEGREAGFVRVDGIEILEPGHPELEGLRDADGKLYFYDIGATRHPSFSVNGLLVHNSSIIKHHAAKTLQTLLETFRTTPYKLCATATPAPNDWTELGNHAEFLGVRSRAEMLAEFFVHDGGDTQVWRLKGHARHLFWRWVASWGAMVRSPADLGHDAAAYELPPLTVHPHTVEIEHNPAHGLFAMEAQTLMERRDARRQSIADRVKACAEIVNADNQPWVVWCDLNAEGDALTAAIDGAVQISGADDAAVKEHRLHDFAQGKIRVLVSKVSICGFGLNWQHCKRMAFVGVTDSFESYYQAVRRCWRFGQKHPVHVHVFASNQEGAVVQNLKRKEADAKAMAEAMAAETIEAVRSSVLGAIKETNPYQAAKAMNIPSFLRAA